MEYQNDITAEEIATNEYPGFAIQCTCGSKRVALQSDFGYSSISGCWGGVSLLCLDCKNEVTIWGK